MISISKTALNCKISRNIRHYVIDELQKLFMLAVLLYSPGSSAIDLNGVYNLAKERDSTVQQVREQLGATRENIPQAEARLLPFVSVAASSQRLDVSITQHSEQQAAMGSASRDRYTQNNLTLQVSYPLYHRDYWIQLEQSKDTVSQGEAQLAEAEIDLMIRTATAYFNVLAAADELQAATAEKTANAKQLEQSQQRFKVGVIAITDVNESQAAYDSALAKEITSNNALSDAWESLNEITGELSQPLAKIGDTLPLHQPEPDNVETWAETALHHNYNIQAAQKALEQAKKGIDKQHSGYFPTLDLVGSYGVADASSNVFGNNQNTGMIGLQLNVPLYQGGAVSSREKQAVQEYRAAQNALDLQRKTVNRQVRDAYRGVLSAISKVNALKSALVSSQTALDSTQAGFEVGTRTMVDVLTVTKNLYQAQRDYARARYDYIINGLLLYQAAGNLTPEIITKANSWLSQEKIQMPPNCH